MNAFQQTDLFGGVEPGCTAFYNGPHVDFVSSQKRLQPLLIFIIFMLAAWRLDLVVGFGGLKAAQDVRILFNLVKQSRRISLFYLQLLRTETKSLNYQATYAVFHRYCAV